jgi:hypothetical protein
MRLHKTDQDGSTMRYDLAWIKHRGELLPLLSTTAGVLNCAYRIAWLDLVAISRAGWIGGGSHAFDPPLLDSLLGAILECDLQPAVYPCS